MLSLKPFPVKYRGTLTGLRISSVDGTAFIDNAGATVPTYADGNHLIEIYDASGRMLKGVLKAAGAAETLDSELVTNGTDWTGGPPPTGWPEEFGATLVAVPDAGPLGAGDTCVQLTNADNSNYIFRRDITTAVGALYKHGGDVKSGTGGNTTFHLYLYVSAGDNSDLTGTTTASWVSHSKYYTALSTTYSASNQRTGGTGTGLFDNITAKKVLTPSTAGATIVTLKSGTTYNFAYKNASFTYNAASYYVIVKKMRN